MTAFGRSMPSCISVDVGVRHVVARSRPVSRLDWPIAPWKKCAERSSSVHVSDSREECFEEVVVVDAATRRAARSAGEATVVCSHGSHVGGEAGSEVPASEEGTLGVDGERDLLRLLTAARRSVLAALSSAIWRTSSLCSSSAICS